MRRNVTATVKGRAVQFDFDGFDGDECVTERERIRRELLRLGIRSDVRDRRAKASATSRVSGQRARPQVEH